MSLTMTEQKMNGGATKLVVREGRRVLLTFPLEMRDLAEEMVSSGEHCDDESEYPSLIEHYSLEMAKREPPGLPHAKDVEIKPHIITAAEVLENFEPIRPKTFRLEKVVEQPPVENGGYAIDPSRHPPYIPAKEFLAEFKPLGHAGGAKSEPPAPWQIPVPDAGNEVQPEKQVLADLLEAARQAEIALATARETLHHARVDFKGAEDCAEAAWKAFNEALRSSLPEDSNVKGIVMSGGIIELLSNMAAST